MDDSTQKVFLKVELDTSDLIQKSADAKQVLDSLKSSQKQLADSGQQGTQAFADISQQVRAATQSYAAANKELDNTVKQNNAATGSLTEMKANLSLLTKQYNDLSGAERNNQEVGGILQKQIKTLSDELKTNESALGDNHRNVGNYTEGVTAALNATDLFGGGISGLTTQVQANADTLTNLVKVFAGVSETQLAAAEKQAAAALREAEASAAAAAAQTEQAAAAKAAALSEDDLLAAEELTTAAALAQVEANEGLATAQAASTAATEAATVGFSGLRVAIAATGIGAIILAIISLITYFKDTKAGADLFSEAMAALKAIFTELIQPLIKIGEFLVSAFKDPKQAVIDLADAIETNIVNRIVGLIELIPKLGEAIKDVFQGKFAEAGQVAFDAVTKVGTGIADASSKIQKFGEDIATSAQQAAALEKQQIALEDAQRQVNVQTSENNALVKDLIIQSKNKTLADKERIDVLNQASKLELENSKQAIAIAKQQYDVVVAQNALEAKGRELTDAQEDKAAAALIKIQDLRGSSAELQDKIINRQDALGKEISDKAIKRAEDEAKAKQKIDDDAQKTLESRLKDRTALEKVLLADSIKGSQDELNEQISVARAIANEELAQKNLTVNEKLLIEKNYQASVEKLAEDRIKKQQELAKQALQEQEDTAQNALAKETLNEQIELGNRYDEGELSYKQYQNELAKLQLTAKNKTVALKAQELKQLAALETPGSYNRVKLETQADQMILESYTQTEEKKREENERTEALQKQTTQNYLSITQDVFGGLASLFAQGTEQYKAFATAQAVASTASGAIQAFAAAQDFPYPLNLVMGAISAGVVVAEGVTQIAKINALEDGGLIFPKAAKGMLIGGEPHSRGGTKFVGSDGTRFEAEQGELLAVVNKRSVGMIGRLNAVNMMGGGNNFFEQGGLSYLADGGIASRSLTSPVIKQVNSSNDIKNLLLNLPAPIVRVGDINTAQNKQVRVKLKSTL